MELMSYIVKIISEPYEYYEKDESVQEFLSQIFCNQLRGYKAYYPSGICPISEYDFFTNHIAILDEETQRVLCSYKITDHATCRRYNKRLPITLVIGDHLPEHQKVVAQWLEKFPNSGYNHSWTIDPTLPKPQKKELVDITFAILAQFYIDRKIENIIDINVIPYKIHLIKEWMGNVYLDLPSFGVKEYNNQLSCLMVNEGLKFSEEFRFSIKKYEKLWLNRVEITASDYEDEAAA